MSSNTDCIRKQRGNRAFTISLCLNLALAGAAFCLWNKTDSPTTRIVATTVSTTTTSLATASLPVPSKPSAPVTCVTNPFTWNCVEAEDFEQLAMNLRAIGCPEKTVRDIVVARARRALEHIAQETDPKLPFWTAGLRRTQAQHETEREVAAAHAKLLASVEGAVGPGVFIEDGKLMEDFVEQAIVRFFCGPMPEEKFSRLAVLFVRQEARRDEIRARTHGVLLDEDEAVLNDLGRQSQQELAAVLPPAELEELAARHGMMRLMKQVRFEATDLSLAEIRGVALIRARFDEPTMGEWSNSDSLTEAQEAQFAKAVRELLGESRYAQIERAKDGDFQTLFELGRDHGLPRFAAAQVFELRQFAAQEVAQLRADNSLSASERQQWLAQMQTQAQAAVLKLLGANACTKYLERSGAWLTNFSGL